MPGMAAVEELIGAKIQCEAASLTDISAYLLTLGGKRIRPILALLTACACGSETPRPALIEVAAGIELIHMATLLHDDIIDHSPLRRHKPSAYAQYGLGDTLLTGDFLLVRAFGLCARLDRQIIDWTEEACVHLTEGEILEVSLTQKNHTIESSIEIARKKTAALFRLAAACGSYLALENNPQRMGAVKAFSEFGEALGIGFQILDDILDVISDESLLGKKSGTDLRERKPSLVNVLWLESGDLEAQFLRAAPGDNDEATIARALETLKSSPVIDDAKARAHGYANKARESLQEGLIAAGQEQSDWAKALHALIDFSIERLA